MGHMPCEMHAYEMHANEVYPHEMHTRKIHAHEVHACEMIVSGLHRHRRYRLFLPTCSRCVGLDGTVGENG
jgi:hypothetical protein